LLSIAQVDAMTSLALHHLSSPRLFSMFNLLGGKMSSPAKPTVRTLAISLTGETDFDQEVKTLEPLSSPENSLETQWRSARAGRDTLVMRFETREVGADGIPLVQSHAPAVEITVKGVSEPEVTSWRVVGSES